MDHGVDDPEEPLRQEMGCRTFRDLPKEGASHVLMSLGRPNQGLKVASSGNCCLPCLLSAQERLLGQA